MAGPVLALLSLLARAMTAVLTHPTIWLMTLGWVAISRFDLGVAENQLQRSITELWWLVVLILLTAICNTAVNAYLQARRRASAGQCAWCNRFCSDELIWEPACWPQPVALAIGTSLIVGATIYELRRRTH